MARRKPTKNDKKKNDKSKRTPLRFEHNRQDFTWASVRRALAGMQTKQQNVRKKIEEQLLPRYIAFTDDAEREAFLREGGKDLKKETRQNADLKWRVDQAQLEDFLFYQNPMNRWKRLNPVRPTEEQNQEAAMFNKRPMLLDPHGEKPGFVNYYIFLRQMLNYYDQRQIGTALYRSGDIDVSGEIVREEEEADEPRLVPPDELHLWTPPWRRVPVGLRSIAVRLRMQEAMEEPYEVHVDEEAIEEVRKKFDDKEDNETEGLEYSTHSARRKAQHDEYSDTPKPAGLVTRPSTSNVRKDGEEREDRFHMIQTQSGVFISALESSYDWLTSYDCLGLVKNSGITEEFEVSAVRDEDWILERADDENDDDMHNDIPDPTIPRGEEDDVLKPLPGGKNKKHKAATGNTTRVTRSQTRDIPETKVPPKQPPKKNGKRKTAGDDLVTKTPEDWERVTANIDYPYEKHEFTKPAKILKRTECKLDTTSWAEATNGRREWHVGMAYKPASPVDSPPHSPIAADTINLESIPDGCDDTEISNVQPHLRRCPHGDERCRAWWYHPAEECWKVHEESTSLPTNRMEIDPPIDLEIPEERREKYRNRLHDHYGRTHVNGDQKWPRLGIRVPYEPTTFADFKRDIQPEAFNDDLEDDEIDRPLQGWRSLAMPIIATPQNPWNSKSDTLYPDNGDSPGENPDDGDDGGLSDDEGDLFRDAYLECSRPSWLPEGQHAAMRDTPGRDRPIFSVKFGKQKPKWQEEMKQRGYKG